MQAQVFDFRWVDEEHCEIQAVLGRKFGRRKVQIGDRLSLAVVSGPSCVGYWYDADWHECPEHSVGRAKCEMCKSRERNFVFTVFDGFDQSHVNEQDLDLIRGEHLVYIAFLGKDLLKIGVCKKERKALRQLEQGSFFTLFIAETPDGISARQIETLFKRSGIADKIKKSQKKNFICPDVDVSEAESLMRKTFEDYQSSLSEHPHLREFLMNDPEFVDWGKVYGLPYVERNSKPFHAVKLQKSESVSGKIVAIKGPFLCFETSDELVSVCIKDTCGYTVDFSNIPDGLKINNALQSSLF